MLERTPLSEKRKGSLLTTGITVAGVLAHTFHVVHAASPFMVDMS